MELIHLVRSVFPSLPQDHAMGILVDIPKDEKDDNADWQKRRLLASQWFKLLQRNAKAIGLERVHLFAYKRVGSNNANLPEHFTAIVDELPQYANFLSKAGKRVESSRVFADVQIFIAPTEYSATAPLKLAAKIYEFRAATMPGFKAKMISALRLDFQEVNRRLLILKDKLDDAESATIKFAIQSTSEYQMMFDLRFRTAAVSGGRFPQAGQVGNLPSGETYIVPYEGEKEPSSRTEGILPVQFGDEVVLYEVIQNRARKVIGTGEAAITEREHLEKEPAYGNLAELGFGVLRDFAIQPINEILLDEKLGLHIAFGRSDHFGGFVGANQFSSAEALVHIDRIYIPECQPKIKIQSVTLQFENRPDKMIMKNGKYLLF